MSQNREIQFSAFIGIDWADRKHDISSDAALQVDFLMKHRDKLSPWFPDAPETRTLNRLVEMRRNLVHDKTRLTNKMTSLLKDYFPQVLELFSDKDTQVFCDFLLRWPTHKKAQRVRKKTLMNFLRSHNSYRSALFEKRF
ncbi:MAG: IS110 family transposase, partial [Proteobacteria bacterium]|nr:IS110 family transposase [Pseudomonadota bacterium]